MDTSLPLASPVPIQTPPQPTGHFLCLRIRLRLRLWICMQSRFRSCSCSHCGCSSVTSHRVTSSSSSFSSPRPALQCPRSPAILLSSSYCTVWIVCNFGRNAMPCHAVHCFYRARRNVQRPPTESCAKTVEADLRLGLRCARINAECCAWLLYCVLCKGRAGWRVCMYGCNRSGCASRGMTRCEGSKGREMRHAGIIYRYAMHRYRVGARVNRAEGGQGRRSGVRRRRIRR